MAISIGSNITSLQAQRRLDLTGSKLSDSFNKLSSGYRINSGSDDAAGLAIAESLKAQSRIAGQIHTTVSLPSPSQTEHWERLPTSWRVSQSLRLSQRTERSVRHSGRWYRTNSWR